MDFAITFKNELSLKRTKALVQQAEVAGFKYVPRPIPMKNSMNSTIYYLFFASHQNVAMTVVNDIFNKYRILGAR